MSLKFLMPFCLVFALLSCKDTSETSTGDLVGEEVKSTQVITQIEIAKLKYIDFGLDADAEKLIENWEEYIQIQQLIQNVKLADFSELKENNKVLKTLMKDFKKKMPKPLKSSSILARVMVFETKLFKMESFVNLSNIKKEELGETIKEFLLAFSNLNYQINKKLERDSQNIEKPV
ncbi:MAG: hypothetical protein ABJK28_18770 [Algibacter sp.]